MPRAASSSTAIRATWPSAPRSKTCVPDAAILARCEIRFAAEHRPDDDPIVVRKRLDVYRAQTAPVADHFEAIGKLRHVDGVGEVQEVFKRILAVLPR